MRPSARSWLTTLPVLLLAAGCPAGRPPVESAVGAAAGARSVREVAATVVVCKTTEEELRAALGRPYRDGRLGDWRILSWTPPGDDASHYLAVVLRATPDAAPHVVVDVYYDVPSEIPWTPTDRCR